MSAQGKQPQLALLNSYSQEFRAKLRRINSFTDHPSSIGSSHEGILRRFLQQYTPKRFAVNEGFIIDDKGNASSQCDIIIWSALDHSPFYADGDFAIVPARPTRAVIEIKTSLTKSTLQEAFKQLKPIHEMNDKIYTAIFAFESQGLKKILEHIVFDLDVEVAEAVDSICAMSGWSLQRLGLVLTEKPGLGMLGTPQAMKRDYGDESYLPFVPILPPGNDEGFDLVAFLGFLFGSLELPSNPTIELLYDAKAFINSPIIPGFGRPDPTEEISPEDVRKVFDEFWQSIEESLSTTPSSDARR